LDHLKKNFIFLESPSSSTQFIDTNSRRFFHPKLKTITTEKLREMAEEKIKINEQKRQEEEELNINGNNGFTIVNGFSSAESNGKRATAVSIRDEILDGISFQNGEFCNLFSSSWGLISLFFSLNLSGLGLPFSGRAGTSHLRAKYLRPNSIFRSESVHFGNPSRSIRIFFSFFIVSNMGREDLPLATLSG